MRTMKMKKNKLIKLDKDISFEDAMKHIANTSAKDVDAAMKKVPRTKKQMPKERNRNK